MGETRRRVVRYSSEAFCKAGKHECQGSQEKNTVPMSADICSEKVRLQDGHTNIFRKGRQERKIENTDYFDKD